MSKNTCYTYFTITGDFKTSDITHILGMKPSDAWNMGDPMPGGRTEYSFSRWSGPKYSKYTFDVTKQMEAVVMMFADRLPELEYIKKNYNADFTLAVVPKIYPDESTPALAPSHMVMDFCLATGTEIDIDLYVCESE